MKTEAGAAQLASPNRSIASIFGRGASKKRPAVDVEIRIAAARYDETTAIMNSGTVIASHDGGGGFVISIAIYRGIANSVA